MASRSPSVAWPPYYISRNIQISSIIDRREVTEEDNLLSLLCSFRKVSRLIMLTLKEFAHILCYFCLPKYLKENAFLLNIQYNTLQN